MVHIDGSIGAIDKHHFSEMRTQTGAGAWVTLSVRV